MHLAVADLRRSRARRAPDPVVPQLLKSSRAGVAGRSTINLPQSYGRVSLVMGASIRIEAENNGEQGKQQWGAAAILLLASKRKSDKGPNRCETAGCRSGRRNRSAKFCC